MTDPVHALGIQAKYYMEAEALIKDAWTLDPDDKQLPNRLALAQVYATLATVPSSVIALAADIRANRQAKQDRIRAAIVEKLG